MRNNLIWDPQAPAVTYPQRGSKQIIFLHPKLFDIPFPILKGNCCTANARWRSVSKRGEYCSILHCSSVLAIKKETVQLGHMEGPWGMQKRGAAALHRPPVPAPGSVHGRQKLTLNTRENKTQAVPHPSPAVISSCYESHIMFFTQFIVNHSWLV